MIPRRETPRREGFWKSREEPVLPFPFKYPMEWDEDGFVEAILKVQNHVEKNLKHVSYCKGFSECRMCEKANGCAEFEHGGWVWPSGFLHYVRGHGVRPSLAFEEFIRHEAEGLEP